MGLVTGEIFIKSYALLPELYHFKSRGGFENKVFKQMTSQKCEGEPLSIRTLSPLLLIFVRRWGSKLLLVTGPVVKQMR